MDRIDAMSVFVTALDEGSFARAALKLGRSPAAVSRAVAFLEDHVGVPLLHRTTRSSKLSEAGERYATVCRRLLTDLHEADILAAREKSAPGGTITLTAPVLCGEELLRPVLDDFLDVFSTVSVKLLLKDRVMNLINEGIDVALRIGHLSDSSMVSVRVGAVRQVVVAAPSYLSSHPPIEVPGDLEKQQIITQAQVGLDSWRFPPSDTSTVPRVLPIAPRLVINDARAVVASAVEGRGVARLFSHQVADHIRDGRLRLLLEAHEFPPLPVHLVMPERRISMPKVRAFVDFGVPRLRARFAQLAVGTDG